MAQNATISEIEQEHLEGKSDFLKMRDRLKNEVLADFGSLLDVEKRFLVSVYVYPVTFTQVDIDSYFTAQEQFVNWKVLQKKAQKDREARVGAAKEVVSFYLTMPQTKQMYNDVATWLSGYTFANTKNLVLFLDSGVDAAEGIDFTLTGFESKSYYNVTAKDKALDILKNGNY